MGEVVPAWGQGVKGNSGLTAQFCCESTTALQNKINFFFKVGLLLIDSLLNGDMNYFKFRGAKCPLLTKWRPRACSCPAETVLSVYFYSFSGITPSALCCISDSK